MKSVYTWKNDENNLTVGYYMLHLLLQSLKMIRKTIFDSTVFLIILGSAFIAGIAIYHTVLVVISALTSLAKIGTSAGIYAAAVNVYTSLNPVHSLLALITVFFLTALFLLALGAEFLAYTFLIVYVGAIAILFLFVIILLDIKSLTATQSRLTQKTANVGVVLTYIAASFIIFTSADYFINFTDRSQFVQFLTEPSSVSFLVRYVTQEFRDISIFSNLLYGYYSLIFMLISLLLLTAMLGAIVLATSTSEPART
jgi:NADH-quinone oxidoreductase subunit J